MEKDITMKFSDVFPLFESTEDCVDIVMDEGSAAACTPKQAVKFSRMKFEKILKAAQKLRPDSYFYPELGVFTCPLCTKFFREACKGCPIRNKAGKIKCVGTPYDDIVESSTVAEYIPALEAEIAFLKEIEAEL